MKNYQLNKFSALIARDFEDNISNIDWEEMANIFNFVNVIGEYENNIFRHYSADRIVANAITKNCNNALNMFYYIYYRNYMEYDSEVIEEIEEYVRSDEKDSLIFSDTDNLKIFISFSTCDQDLAEEIQEFFEDRGLDCFLSANKLETSDIWKESIANEIKTSQVCIFVLSEKFKESDWCSQEAGMAILKNKVDNKILICPVPIEDMEPYGFINDYHGPIYEGEKTLNSILNKIRKTYPNCTIVDVENDEIIVNKELEDLIGSLPLTGFASSNIIFDKIRSHIKDITSKQVDTIIEYSLNNDQILYSFEFKSVISPLIVKFKSELNDENVKLLKKSWAEWF